MYPEQQVFVPFTLQNFIIVVSHVYLNTFDKVNSGFAKFVEVSLLSYLTVLNCIIINSNLMVERMVFRVE